MVELRVELESNKSSESAHKVAYNIFAAMKNKNLWGACEWKARKKSMKNLNQRQAAQCLNLFFFGEITFNKLLVNFLAFSEWYRQMLPPKKNNDAGRKSQEEEENALRKFLLSTETAMKSYMQIAPSDKKKLFYENHITQTNNKAKLKELTSHWGSTTLTCIKCWVEIWKPYGFLFNVISLTQQKKTRKKKIHKKKWFSDKQKSAF